MSLIPTRKWWCGPCYCQNDPETDVCHQCGRDRDGELPCEVTECRKPSASLIQFPPSSAKTHPTSHTIPSRLKSGT
jgi:hypothetical protein